MIIFFLHYRHEQWMAIKDTDSSALDHGGAPVQQITDKKFGTIGAVACDAEGNIAAATSTGGMTNKKWGRIGDSPL